MADTFHLVDLVSQAHAVNQWLAGKTDEEIILWIASKGRLDRVISSALPRRDIYRFVSTSQREALFFLDAGELVFVGDHTTLTSRPDVSS